MGNIYLDYAATTPMDKEVLKAMMPYFSDKFGNPGSIHSFGQEAIAAIDESREKIAKAIGADFREVIFTGSATEANNLALRGVVRAVQLFSDGTGCPPTPAVGGNLDSRRGDSAFGGDQARRASETFRAKTTEPPYRIIVSKIEHESILETCHDLEKDGVEIIYLPVDKQGFVDLKKLKESLNERTILVSIMYANNEIGVVQNISAIAEIIEKFKNSEKNNLLIFLRQSRESTTKSGQSFNQQYPLFHTDAVQAFQFFNCNVNDLGVDLMTLSAHKIYGPKGIGLLYRRINNSLNPQSSILNPLLTGGGQELGLRSGTENVPAIVGFAKAVELAEKNRKKETKKISELSAYFWKELKKIYLKVEINGTLITKLPNILNIYFPNQNADESLMKLDLSGVAVSSGSACSARATKISHVLKAIGLPENKIKSSLRFSFGKFTTKKEISDTIKIIKNIL